MNFLIKFNLGWPHIHTSEAYPPQSILNTPWNPHELNLPFQPRKKVHFFPTFFPSVHQ